MKYVRTLKEINRTDRELVGERAVDLAILSQHDFSTPLSFVLTNDSFEQFIMENKLRDRIALALQGADPNRIYERIRELILNTNVPQEIVSEIVEAYESLSVEENTGINGIVKSNDAPYVNLIISPNHTVPSDNKEGIILNVKGLEELLVALQECWACLFTPNLQRHRIKAGVSNRNLNVGIIIQKMLHGDVSAEAWSATGSDLSKITVKSYYGVLDVGVGVEKDVFRLNREYLKPVYQSVGIQTQLLTRDESGKLGKSPLGPRGEEQKLNDRLMIELGRLTKKASRVLESPVMLLFNVHDETIKILLCNRLLLTAGSVKLQGYKDEEVIEEGDKEGDELSGPPTHTVTEEVEESLVAVDDEGDSAVVAHTTSKRSSILKEEEQEQEYKEDSEDQKHEMKDEPLLEGNKIENKGIKEEEIEKVMIEGSPEKFSDADGVDSVAEESVDETLDEPSGRAVLEESIFASVESGKREEVSETSTNNPAEDLVENQKEDGGESDDDETTELEDCEVKDAEANKEAEEESKESKIGVEKISEYFEEEAEVGGESSGGVVEYEEENTIKPSQHSPEEAIKLVREALTQRYERRFRNPPPSDFQQLFNELRSEVIIPHEELIAKVVEQEPNLPEDTANKLLALIDEFLEAIR